VRGIVVTTTPQDSRSGALAGGNLPKTSRYPEAPSGYVFHTRRLWIGIRREGASVILGRDPGLQKRIEASLRWRSASFDELEYKPICVIAQAAREDPTRMWIMIIGEDIASFLI
jgi:hypothetical protein